MKQTRFDLKGDIAWCPGCGNFLLLQLLKDTLDELDVDPTNIVISSGIGQAAKMPQYVNTSFFNACMEELFLWQRQFHSPILSCW